jgi:hypothetical protein
MPLITKGTFKLKYLLLALVGAALISSQAGAATDVQIEWATSGAGPVSNPDVVAQVGDTLTATIYLENVGGSVLAYTIGAQFDSVELALLTSTEFLPTGFTDHVNAGTGNRGLCSGLMFEAIALPPATAVAGRFAIGQAEFEVISVVDDGQPDLVTETCSGTTDESLYDGSFVDLSDTTTFQSGGSATTLPPSVPSLGAWGLAALAAVFSVSVLAVSRRARAAA